MLDSNESVSIKRICRICGEFQWATLEEQGIKACERDTRNHCGACCSKFHEEEDDIDWIC
jgi:hypothetical protein